MSKCQCPNCQGEYDIPAIMLGKRVKCKKCQATFTASEVSQNKDNSSSIDWDDVLQDGPSVNRPAHMDPGWIGERVKSSSSSMSLVYLLCTALAVIGVFTGLSHLGDEKRSAVHRSFSLVGQRRDSVGNIMELFGTVNPVSAADLRELCRQRRDASTASNFHIVVIFDETKWATFPSTPILSGGYNLDELESESVRHIIARYTCNSRNGFSELIRYERNMAQSRGIEERID